jgi:myo-inositol-1(or 4)-monophosphatase
LDKEKRNGHADLIILQPPEAPDAPRPGESPRFFMSAHPTEITTRIEAAKAAVMAETGLLHREFGKAESRWKSDGTRVTAIDIAISENIFRSLRAAFPQDQMFSEELPEGESPIPVTSRFGWVLDPIDGTNNFALGIPYCAISLALIERG